MFDLDIDPLLKDDLDRWVASFENDPFKSNKTLGVYDVLSAHYLIVDHFYKQGEGMGGIGPRNKNLLASTLGRQLWRKKFINQNDDLDICATLFFGLIKNHPFHDGNKRTAFLSLLYHLWLIGRTPEAKHEDFEKLALRVAKNSLSEYKQYDRFSKKDSPEVKFISHFLGEKTRKINHKSYLVTYREFNARLKIFGFFLSNPKNNSIEIVRIEEKRKLFCKPEVIEKGIGSIAFPGWTREVGRAEIKLALKMTELTPEKGIDSEVFFKDALPLGVYIERYKGLLERLADK